MIGQNILKALQKNGISQYRAAKDLGISASRLNQYITGVREPDAEIILMLCDYLNITPDFLYGRSESLNENINTIKVPVIGYVQAGQWQDAITWDNSQIYYAYLPQFEEYKGCQICALEIRGDSMNKIYPEGSYVAYISAYDYVDKYGEIPSGKKVICHRKNPENNTIEATVKEYVKNDDGSIWLVPHSTNLIHQACRQDTGECGETNIIGVVIWSGRKE